LSHNSPEKSASCGICRFAGKKQLQAMAKDLVDAFGGAVNDFIIFRTAENTKQRTESTDAWLGSKTILF
jgi:hypothetical protein